MRGYSILFGLSIAGATGAYAGPIEIELSEDLSVVSEGIFVLDVWSPGGLDEEGGDPLPAMVEESGVGGLDAPAEDAVIEAGAEDLAEEVLAEPEAPARRMMNAEAFLEEMPLAGTYDMTSSFDETLDASPLPEAGVEEWVSCEGSCFSPEVDLFGIWPEMADADLEDGGIDIDAETVEETLPAHASLPATAMLLGGALGALAFRQRRRKRA